MTVKKLEAKALLIDLDGTLVDSLEVFAEAAEAALSAIGCRQSSEDVGLKIARNLQRNLPLDDFFDKTGVDTALREKFLAIFLQAFYDATPTKTKPFPNVDKTVRKLSKDFKLALITRRRVPKDLVKAELQRLHLDCYFKAIVTALEVERSTPFPDAILKAADELHVLPYNCVVISDSGVDLQAGRSAGAKTVAVLSGLFEEEELKDEMPDLIIKDISYLPEHLRAM